MDISRTFKTPPPQSPEAVAASSSPRPSSDDSGPSALDKGKLPARSVSPEERAAASRARDRLARHRLPSSPSSPRTGAKRHCPEEVDKKADEEVILASEKSEPCLGASSISVATGKHLARAKKSRFTSPGALSSLRLTPSHVIYQNRIEDPSQITYEATYLTEDGNAINTQVDFF